MTIIMTWSNTVSVLGIYILSISPEYIFLDGYEQKQNIHGKTFIFGRAYIRY